MHGMVTEYGRRGEAGTTSLSTAKTQHEIRHVYIKEAVRLRPDLSQLPPVDFAELEAWIAEQMEQFQK